MTNMVSNFNSPHFFETKLHPAYYALHRQAPISQTENANDGAFTEPIAGLVGDVSLSVCN